MAHGALQKGDEIYPVPVSLRRFPPGIAVSVSDMTDGPNFRLTAEKVLSTLLRKW